MRPILCTRCHSPQSRFTVFDVANAIAVATRENDKRMSKIEHRNAAHDKAVRKFLYEVEAVVARVESGGPAAMMRARDWLVLKTGVAAVREFHGETPDA